MNRRSFGAALAALLPIGFWPRKAPSGPWLRVTTYRHARDKHDGEMVEFFTTQAEMDDVPRVLPPGTVLKHGFAVDLNRQRRNPVVLWRRYQAPWMGMSAEWIEQEVDSGGIVTKVTNL